MSPEIACQIAEHATDDALTPGEISVLRLIAGGNANKEIADRIVDHGRNRQGSSQEHPRQTGCQRSYPPEQLKEDTNNADP